MLSAVAVGSCALDHVLQGAIALANCGRMTCASSVLSYCLTTIAMIFCCRAWSYKKHSVNTIRSKSGGKYALDVWRPAGLYCIADQYTILIRPIDRNIAGVYRNQLHPVRTGSACREQRPGRLPETVVVSGSSSCMSRLMVPGDRVL